MDEIRWFDHFWARHVAQEGQPPWVHNQEGFQFGSFQIWCPHNFWNFWPPPTCPHLKLSYSIKIHATSLTMSAFPRPPSPLRSGHHIWKLPDLRFNKSILKEFCTTRRSTFIKYPVFSPDFTYDEDGNMLSADGFLVDLLKLVQSQLNFTSSLSITVDGKFGGKDQDVSECSKCAQWLVHI